MLEIQTDVNKVSDAIKKVSETLPQSLIKIGIWETLPMMSNDAKRMHRHQRRTGKLERSIKVVRRKDGGSIYIDDASCDYGKFVHRGQRTWKPDEFVFETYQRNERVFDTNIDKAINDALKKAGF